MNLYSLQPAAIRLARIRPVRLAFLGLYALGRFFFLRMCRHLQKDHGRIAAVYLRGSAARGELEPAASDLNWVVVWENLPGDREMEAVKAFWAGFGRLKRVFPFLSEPRLLSLSDLEHWLSQPLMGTREKWILELGREVRRNAEQNMQRGTRRIYPRKTHGENPLESPPLASAEDLFHVRMDEWWKICHALVKIEWFTDDSPLDPVVRLRLRSAAKAMADFHVDRRDGGREAILRSYGLHPLLCPHGPLPEKQELWQRFMTAGLQCLKTLHREAPFLLQDQPQDQHRLRENGGVLLLPHRQDPDEIPEDLPLRELYAEKMVFTANLSRALVSHWDGHVWLALREIPATEEEWFELIHQARDTGFPFRRMDTSILLTEQTLHALERTLLPALRFHDWGAHTEISIDEKSDLTSAPLQAAECRISHATALRLIHELGIEMRSRPRPDARHFHERILGLALALRASVAGIASATTGNAGRIRALESLQPLRAQVLRERIGMDGEGDARLWDIFQTMERRLSEIDPDRGRSLSEKIRSLKRSPMPDSRNLWVELGPFLRSEVNALRDRLSRDRPSLRL